MVECLVVMLAMHSVAQWAPPLAGWKAVRSVAWLVEWKAANLVVPTAVMTVPPTVANWAALKVGK